MKARRRGGGRNMVVGSTLPSCPVILLLRLFLSCPVVLLLLLSPLSRAQDAAGNSTSADLVNSINSTTTLNSVNSTTKGVVLMDYAGNSTDLSNSMNSTTTSLNSNSTKGGMVQYPAVSLSLSLGISQELNPNPFIHPNPMLSVSLSLSVSEELRGNPFDLMNLLPPNPQPDQEDQPDHQQYQQEQHRPLQRPEEQQQQLTKEDLSQGRRSSKVMVKRKCMYTVIIKTSCSSPRATRDAISLAFGDAYRSEVYAARLDDPASGTFDRCSIDTFRVEGPCGGLICYLYLRRSGRDGWTPEYAKVFYTLKADPRAAVTFPYEAPLPDGIWYGFNYCHDTATALPKATASFRSFKSDDGDKDKDDDKGNSNDDDDDGNGDPTIKMKTKVAGSVKTVIFKI